MYYIQQSKKDDCGFTCLKIVLANLNKDKNYLFLPQDESHSYYSYSEIIKLGKKHGVNFEGFKATEKESLINCTNYPLILSIDLKNGGKHAVVVTKVKWKRVFFIDPLKGKGSLSLKKFIEIWDGTGLMVESHEKMKCEYDNVDPIPLISRIGLGTIEFVSGIFAILGIYFIKDDTPIYVPAIFLSLAIISELLMHAVAYRTMKKLDDYFFSEDKMPKNNLKEYLSRFENYKKLSLSSPMNYVLLLVFSLGLIAIVLLNDRRNAMLVAVPLVVAIFDLLIISPLLKKKKAEVAELENSLEEMKETEEIQDGVKRLHNSAYNYSYLKVACQYIYAGLMVATSLLTMRLCGISSFPYIIFYSCISITLFKSINQLLTFNDRIDEFNIVKVRLNNLINHQKENK